MEEKDWYTKLKVVNMEYQARMRAIINQEEVWQAHVRMKNEKETETKRKSSNCCLDRRCTVYQLPSRGPDSDMIVDPAPAPVKTETKRPTYKLPKWCTCQLQRPCCYEHEKYLSRCNHREEDTEMVIGGSGSSRTPVKSQQKDVIDMTDETKKAEEHAREELISQAEIIDDEEQEQWEAEQEEIKAQTRWDETAHEQPSHHASYRNHILSYLRKRRRKRSAARKGERSTSTSTTKSETRRETGTKRDDNKSHREQGEKRDGSRVPLYRRATTGRRQCIRKGTVI
jgi:hypothetical protein